MATPAYHLRTNKAVDRFLFIDFLRHYISPENVDNYRYFSFGGPYLEDFGMLHASFPKMEMCSIEYDEETYKRQVFHLNNSKCHLHWCDVESYIDQMPLDKKPIFWLDFTGLKPKHFDTYEKLLGLLPEGSVVRLTVEANPQNHVNPIGPDGEKVIKGDTDKEAIFKKKYAAFLSGSGEELDLDPLIFCMTLQKMVAVSAQRALREDGGGLVLQPICSFYYKDGAGMMTHTAIVTSRENSANLLASLASWPYLRPTWDAKIQLIEMPTLSAKERLHLQPLLPCNDDSAKLVAELGYKIEGDKSEDLMAQYAKFYREYPSFIKASV